MKPIPNDKRVVQRAIPPQLRDDWASNYVLLMTDNDMLASASLTSIGTKMGKNIFMKGSLNHVFGMITGM